MDLMSKGDLFYKDYSWTVYGDDDPKVSGPPDSTMFNRKEGYEVLYLINKIAEIHNLKKLDSGLKMEKMIHDKLPGNVRSQENVKAWIVDNWKNPSST